MSLVNQMLKDLEKRKAQGGVNSSQEHSETEKPVLSETSQASMNTINEQSAKDDSESESAFSGLTPPEEPQHKKIPIRWIIWTLILVLVILFIIWFFRSPAKKEMKKIESVASVKSTATSKAKTNPNVKIQNETKQSKAPLSITEEKLADETLLKNFSIKTQDKQELLILTLEHPVHYHMQVDQLTHLITLVLDNTKYDKELFKLKNHRIIQSITPKEVDHDLYLSIQVLPDTQLQTLQYNKQQPNQLYLTLFNPQATTLGQEKTKQVEAIQKKLVPLTPEQKAEKNYQQALSLISEDHIDDAIKTLAHVIKEMPNYVAARRTLVVLLMKQDDMMRAEDYLINGLKITPDSIDLIELYARVLTTEGRNHKALSVLQSISPAIDENPDYYALMATIQQRLGNFRIAIQLYKELIELEPTNAIWWVGLGTACENADLTNAAQDAYKRALSIGNLTPSLQAYIQSKLQSSGSIGD